MIDVLYVWTQSLWGEELRYSLRSLCLHVQHSRLVVATSDQEQLPHWLIGAQQVKVALDPAWTKEERINHQIEAGLMACRSETVLFMNDDWYFLDSPGPLLGRAIAVEPYDENTALRSYHSMSPWQQMMVDTLVRLKHLNHGQNLYSTHTPTLVSREFALQGFSLLGYDHQFESGYFNRLTRTPDLFLSDHPELRAGFFAPHYPPLSVIDDALYLAHDDPVTFGLQRKLRELFPRACKYEDPRP